MEQQNVLNDLVIDSVGAEQLRTFAGWAKFLSIIGFIMCGLIALVGFFAGSIFSSFNRYNEYGNSSAFSGVSAILTVVYIILALVYFVPTLFLYQSAVKLKAALGTADQATLNDGFTKLKACFKFVGILMIILLSLYALVIVFAVIAGSMFK